MSSMFFYTGPLDTIDLSHFDISSTTIVAGMFSFSDIKTVYVKSQSIANMLEPEQDEVVINYIVK